MTTIDRDKLRELAENATPGPWETFKTYLGCDNGIGSASPLVPSDEAVMEDPYSGLADAAFIAATREAVPALLDQIDQAEAERDEWRQTARDEHAAALDLIGVVKERDQRIEAVRDVLDKAHDEFEQPDEDAIRRALDKKV